MKPGDLALVSYPNSDGSLPRVRPVLILAVGPIGPYEDEVVVVAHTSADRYHVSNPRIGDLLLNDWKSFGLNRVCVARCRQLVGLPRTHIGRIIGEVDYQTLLDGQQIARDLLA